MKELKAKQDFFMSNTFYSKGDIVKATNINDVILLNSKGFIEPLNTKEIQEYKNFFTKKPSKKEVNENGTTL